MCGIHTGYIGETIDLKFTFDANGQPINLTTIYATREVYVYKEDGTEETHRTCTVSGAGNNEILESFTLIAPTGKKKVKFKLTKSNGKYRFYDAAIIKVK